MYHEMMTMSLMCGCGYGDIFVGRFRKHLFEAHGECRTYDECVQQFFWRRLPPFQVVKRCMVPKFRNQCHFRTPCSRILERFHACKTAMAKSKLPEKNGFLKLLHREERPLYGQPKYESDDDRIIRTHKGEIVKLRCDYLFPFEREGYEAGNVVEEVIKKRKREKDEQPELQEEARDDEDTVVRGRRSGRKRQEVRSDSEEGECGDTEGEEEALVDMKNEVKLTVTTANSEYGGSPQAPTQEEVRGATEFVFDEEDIHQDVGEPVSEDRSVRESSLVPTDDVGEQESMEVEQRQSSPERSRSRRSSPIAPLPLSEFDMDVVERRKVEEQQRQVVEQQSRQSRNRDVGVIGQGRRSSHSRGRSLSSRGRQNTYSGAVTAVPRIRRMDFEVDYETLMTVQVPIIHEGRSESRSVMSRMLNVPEWRYSEYGQLQFSSKVKHSMLGNRLTMFVKEELRPSMYFVTDLHGKPVAYVSVTLHA